MRPPFFTKDLKALNISMITSDDIKNIPYWYSKNLNFTISMSNISMMSFLMTSKTFDNGRVKKNLYLCKVVVYVHCVKYINVRCKI